MLVCFLVTDIRAPSAAFLFLPTVFIVFASCHSIKNNQPEHDPRGVQHSAKISRLINIVVASVIIIVKVVVDMHNIFR